MEDAANKVLWDYVGRMNFNNCFSLQNEIRESILKGISASKVILVEHDKVVTYGRREDGQSLLIPQAYLEKRGFSVVKTTRGGLATYHGPGQLVIYPIINLKNFKMGVKDYVRSLELSVVDTLAKYSIKAQRREGFPGVWVGEKKIGSLGIHVKKMVTMHGFALNVSTDLEDFKVINPCGFKDLEMTSMVKEGAKIESLEKVGDDFMDSFSKIFKTQVSRAKETLEQGDLNAIV